MQGVRDQLACSKGSTLLILHNCDDIKKDYRQYIPNGAVVSIVMTTRLSDAKNYASAEPQDSGNRLHFQLGGLDRVTAVDLVLNLTDRMRGPETEQQAARLSAALYSHPLAIIVASSLIRDGVYSLEEHVDALRRQSTRRKFLTTESEQAKYGHVSATFEVSADHLQRLASTDESTDFAKVARAALALLDLVGFINRQEVRTDIFVRAWEYEATLLASFETPNAAFDGDIKYLSAQHVAWSQAAFAASPLDERARLFRKGRALLGRVSLVHIDTTRDSLSIHPIVHTWARERVSRADEAWTAAAAALALSAQGSTEWTLFSSELAPHYEVSEALWHCLGRPVPDQRAIFEISVFLCFTYAHSR